MYKFTYNGQEYTFPPFFKIPTEVDLETGEPIEFGNTLQEELGMSQEEADAAHAEGQLNVLRAERDYLISKTDWVAGEDVPQAIKDKWYPYRQALRDITNNYTSLEDVVWPEKPL
jgi:hypothetical protein